MRFVRAIGNSFICDAFGGCHWFEMEPIALVVNDSPMMEAFSGCMPLASNSIDVRAITLNRSQLQLRR